MGGEETLPPDVGSYPPDVADEVTRRRSDLWGMMGQAVSTDFTDFTDGG